MTTKTTTKKATPASLFKKAGIKVTYKNLGEWMEGPSGESVPFFLELSRDRTKIDLEVMEGANVDVIPSTDPNIKQVVLNVNEKAHTVSGYLIARDNMGKEHAAKLASGNFIIGDHSKVTWQNRYDKVEAYLPEHTKFRIVGESREISDPAAFPNTDLNMALHIARSVYIWPVEADVPDSEHSFLIGYDEHEDGKHLFVSVLPSRAKSVSDAHKILRPKGISNKAIRVAEYFYDPVTDEDTINILDHLILSLGYDKVAKDGWKFTAASWGDWCSVSEDYNDNHGADYVAVSPSGVRYALGMITDQEDRHRPVWLGSWHQVHRNNEIDSNGFDYD